MSDPIQPALAYFPLPPITPRPSPPTPPPPRRESPLTASALSEECLSALLESLSPDDVPVAAELACVMRLTIAGSSFKEKRDTLTWENIVICAIVSHLLPEGLLTLPDGTPALAGRDGRAAKRLAIDLLSAMCAHVSGGRTQSSCRDIAAFAIVSRLVPDGVVALPPGTPTLPSPAESQRAPTDRPSEQIDRLPNELLCLVFAADISSPTRAFDLAKVCRNWSGLVRTSPRFFDAFDGTHCAQLRLWGAQFASHEWKLKWPPSDSRLVGDHTLDSLTAFTSRHRSTLKSVELGKDDDKETRSPAVLYFEVFRGLDVCIQSNAPPDSHDIHAPPSMRRLKLASLKYGPSLLSESVCGGVTHLALLLPFLMPGFGFDAALSAILELCPACEVLELCDTGRSNQDLRRSIIHLLQKGAPAGSEVSAPFLERLTISAGDAYGQYRRPKSACIPRTWKMANLHTVVADCFPIRCKDTTDFIDGLIAPKLANLHIRGLRNSGRDDSVAPTALSIALPKWENLCALTFHTPTCTNDLWPMMKGLKQLRSLDYLSTFGDNAEMLVTKLSNSDPEFGGWLLSSLESLTLGVVSLILPVTAMVLNRRKDSSVTTIVELHLRTSEGRGEDYYMGCSSAALQSLVERCSVTLERCVSAGAVLGSKNTEF